MDAGLVIVGADFGELLEVETLFALERKDLGFFPVLVQGLLRLIHLFLELIDLLGEPLYVVPDFGDPFPDGVLFVSLGSSVGQIHGHLGIGVGGLDMNEVGLLHRTGRDGR